MSTHTPAESFKDMLEAWLVKFAHTTQGNYRNALTRFHELLQEEGIDWKSEPRKLTPLLKQWSILYSSQGKNAGLPALAGSQGWRLSVARRFYTFAQQRGTYPYENPVADLKV